MSNNNLDESLNEESNEELNETETDEWLFDEITGMKRKSSMAILNKKRISKYELDELFGSEEM